MDPDINLDSVFSELEDNKETLYASQIEPDDKTRSWIAGAFVISFFILITIVVVGVVRYNFHILNKYCLSIHPSLYKECSILMVDIKDYLPQVMGIVGTPLGFVVGYYFKTAK